MVGCVLLLTLVAACDAGNNPSPTPTSATPAPPPVSAPPTPTPPAAPAGENVQVKRVIDGDTFELADGRQVRVLGIDSCEMSTYGGKDAETDAESNLTSGLTVTLIAQPGVDTDRFGRLLRYVTVNSKDFGLYMVKYDHTGVYQGKPNDAAPDYLQRLYGADLEYAANPPAGRNCDDPNPPVDPAVGKGNGDEDTNVPNAHRPRTGNSGHPCLPGERDGDRDGYCGER
jgi:micrococcal nuclease